jgi:hypothetical protein
MQSQILESLLSELMTLGLSYLAAAHQFLAMKCLDLSLVAPEFQCTERIASMLTIYELSQNV